MERKMAGMKKDKEFVNRMLTKAFNGSLFGVVDLALNLKDTDPVTANEMLDLAMEASGFRKKRPVA